MCIIYVNVLCLQQHLDKIANTYLVNGRDLELVQYKIDGMINMRYRALVSRVLLVIRSYSLLLAYT